MKVIQPLSRASTAVASPVPFLPRVGASVGARVNPRRLPLVAPFVLPLLVPFLVSLLGGCAPGLSRSKETAANARYGVMVMPVTGGVGMRLLDSSLFDTDDSSVRPESASALDRTADLLKRSTRPVLIEGHTDNDGPLGYNEALSKARAEAVAQALIARGVPAARIKTSGLGPQRPIATNDTAQGRALNRRVDILVKRESLTTILGR